MPPSNPNRSNSTDMAAQPQYYLGTGRRKSSVARVYMQKGEGRIKVNNRPIEEHFRRETMHMIIRQPLQCVEMVDNFDLNIRVNGGGNSGQAGAIRLGIARALLVYDPDLRAPLRKAGLLTRDSRQVERKKFGLHKARKRPQYSKR